MTALSPTHPKTIDLNADVGESFGHWRLGDDTAIMASASSVNIACGFHAGDPTTIRRTCAEAAAAGVVIGAHPAYRDLAGFGRRFIDMDPAELSNDVIYQIGALTALARAEGTRVAYVKPHGALYNTIVHHAAQAQAVLDAVLAVDPALPLLVPGDSEIARLAAAAGVSTVTEAFADRAYNPDGSLVARSHPGAVLTQDAAVAQSVGIALRGEVVAIDGRPIRVAARSICVHGDTPGAVALAAAVRQALQDAGVTIRSFV